jgi:hypothetical protein
MPLHPQVVFPMDAHRDAVLRRAPPFLELQLPRAKRDRAEPLLEQPVQGDHALDRAVLPAAMETDALGIVRGCEGEGGRVGGSARRVQCGRRERVRVEDEERASRGRRRVDDRYVGGHLRCARLGEATSG